MKDRREHCFVNKKVFKNIRKTMVLRRFFSLGTGITKVHCIAMVSIRSVERQHSNSHFFSIPFPFFWHFSLRSLPTLPFSECVFFWHFLCEVCQLYRFQNSHSFGKSNFSPRSLPFSEDFADFRCPREYALNCYLDHE